MEASAPPKPGRPRDERASQAILQAALGQLLERGYGGMSMEGVAVAAGVGKPAIYRRHRNKADLVAAAIRSLLPVLDVPDTGSTHEDLKLLAAQARPLTQGPFAVLIGTVLSEAERRPELMEAFRERIAQPRRELLMKVMSAASSGAMCGAGSNSSRPRSSSSAWSSAATYRGFRSNDTWFESAVEFFWRGIRA